MIPGLKHPKPVESAQPKSFTLSGRAYHCYQAGTKYGAHAAYTSTSENLRKLKAHQAAQLIALRDSILNCESHPMSEDHPMHKAVTGLPDLANGLEMVALTFSNEASKCQSDANQIMGLVAGQDTADDVRWRPPWRAWGMLTAAMAIATTIATLVARYAAM